MSLNNLGPDKLEEKAAGIAGPSYQFATIFGCISLSLSTLIIGICFLIHGMYVIIMAYIDILHADVIEVIATTLCTSFELLAGGASFFAVFKKSQAGISMMVIGYNVVTVNILVAFVTQWIEWIVEMNKKGPDKWIPNLNDILYMTCYTGLIILLIILSFFLVYGCLHSLKAVIAAGGTGWERKSYLDLFEEVEEKAFNVAKQRLSNNPELCAALSEATGSYQTASIKMENFVKEDSNPVVHQTLHDRFNQTFNQANNSSSMKKRTTSAAKTVMKTKDENIRRESLANILPDLSAAASNDTNSPSII